MSTARAKPYWPGSCEYRRWHGARWEVSYPRGTEAPDPEEAKFRILDLEEKLLPVAIRKLGRDSAIAQSLYDAGMIESKQRFEVDGFRQYQIFRSKIGVLPPMRFVGPEMPPEPAAARGETSSIAT